MDIENSENLELDKILCAVSEYATLDGGKEIIKNFLPVKTVKEVRELLAYTSECDKLLYKYGVAKIGYFTNITDMIIRASKGSALSCAELLEAKALLKSAREIYLGISSIEDGEIVLVKDLADKLIFDENLERDIEDKIISEDGLSDYASEKLYSIRSRIRSLNEKIRAKLSEYLSKDAQYLQDGIVTIRNDRYVIPVKAEYKNKVRGFVHDRSQSGATFFIEPEYVLELNNELIALSIDEREEVEAILRALSGRLGNLSEKLIKDMEILYVLDGFFARAEYGYVNKCICPKVNSNGYINIIKGRHPLIDRQKIVPVSLELGAEYDILILSGANTGGKTVTLKMCGLFCLMAACGIFIPAAEDSAVSVFDSIFCDVGDRQSIEDSLSTFSSHILKVSDICNNANSGSLVLIDELGGGTNPDEGQALAKAIVKHLRSKGCKGIITTHFTPLKEFAYETDRIENASMEFDSNTLKPLYRIKIGLPGASNAIAISRRLGLDERILSDAVGFLSEGTRSFENVLSRAEESRVQAEDALIKAKNAEDEWNKKLAELNRKIEEVNREKEKISRSARVEIKKIVADRTEAAEEMLAEIEKIFEKEEITQSELIKARTLKNKLADISFEEDEKGRQINDFVPANKDNMKVGLAVFVKPMQSKGVVTGWSKNKDEAEVQCGSIKMHCKLSELSVIGENTENSGKVKVIRNIPVSQPMLEINVLGLTVEEALYEVDNFIDRAVMDNLEEIKVIHGVGTGKLRAAISAHLKRHKNVLSFRAGRYGEGETGVTIIKLK